MAAVPVAGFGGRVTVIAAAAIAEVVIMTLAVSVSVIIRSIVLVRHRGLPVHAAFITSTVTWDSDLN